MPSSTSIFMALGQSLLALGLGYFASVILGLVLGVFIGSDATLCKISSRLLQLPVTVPVVYIVLFLTLTHKNQYAVSLSIAFSSFWFIAIYTGLGLQRAFRRQKYELAVPQIFQGLRFGLTIAWGALITAEVVLSGVQGLGFYVWDAYQNNSISDIFLGIGVITLATFITDQLLEVLGQSVKRAVRNQS